VKRFTSGPGRGRYDGAGRSQQARAGWDKPEVTKESDRTDNTGYQVGRYLSLAFEFAGAVLIFWFLGRLVDNWLDIEPWGQLVGSLFGWVGGFLHVYYATQRR
jgi:F0F1-type ATP synthase assembly protein I